MKFIFTLFFVVIFSGFCYTQTPQKKFYAPAQAIPKVEIWDNQANSKIEANCITPSGNIADLAAYINLHFEYPQHCIDMGYDGNIYMEILLDDSLRLKEIISHRGLCEKEMEKQKVENILRKLLKIYVPNTSKKFLIKIKIELLYGEHEKAEEPILIRYGKKGYKDLPDF